MRREPASGMSQLGARIVAEGLIVTALVTWWIASRSLPEFILPGPAKVALRLVEMFVSPVFLMDTLASVWRVVASVLLAMLIGGSLALLSRGVAVVEPIVTKVLTPFFSAFPSIAWAILAAIWFNPGNLAVLFVQTAILIPFCLINVSAGLRELDLETIEMARSFSRARWRTLRLVTLPLLLPYLVAALRIAYGIAWKISLVSELLGAESGIGQVMLRAQTVADAATMLASCLAIVVMFLLGDTLVFAPLQKRFSTG